MVFQKGFKLPKDLIERNRQARIRYFQEHPEARQKLSESMRKFHQKHRELMEQVT